MTTPSQDRPDHGLPPRPPPASDLAFSPDLEPPAPPAVGDEPGSAGTPESTRLPYTRIRAAWVGVWAGVVAVILLIVFVGQNTAPVNIHFLWLDGQIPTALALLIAGVGGAIIAMAIAAARILQLRRAIRTQ